MKLGARVALVTTFLMTSVLGIATWTVIVILRADQLADLDRHAHAMAATMMAAIEPLAGRGEALKSRVATLSTKRSPFRLEVVALHGEKPNNSWAGLVEESTKLDTPVGRLFEVQGIPPFYAMAVPLHNAPTGDPTRHVTAFLGLVYDGTLLAHEIWGTGRRLLPVLILLIAAFSIAISITLSRRVTAPLRGLIEAIDAVAKGDLSRAVLPVRDDEVGQLASRFNAMMSYLREAREKEAKATAAHLITEEHLHRSEKLATLGQIAAEIAHEVGTPLNVIGGRARSLARRASDAGEVEKNAEIISTQVDRITKIIRQVLDFSRKSRTANDRVNLLQVVQDTLEFVDEKLKQHRISLSLTTDPDLQPIPGDSDAIQQVCLNLIMNAIQVMPDGGRLRVEITYVVRRKEGLALSPPVPYLELSIADTGPGVSEENRTRIFDAFFTTKEKGQGSGLGLAVSRGIVKDHDGFIEVSDAPEGGAIFRVFLPAGNLESQQLPDRPSDTPPPSPEGT